MYSCTAMRLLGLVISSCKLMECKWDQLTLHSSFKSLMLRQVKSIYRSLYLTIYLSTERIIIMFVPPPFKLQSTYILKYNNLFGQNYSYRNNRSIPIFNFVLSLFKVELLRLKVGIREGVRTLL